MNPHRCNDFIAEPNLLQRTPDSDPTGIFHFLHPSTYTLFHTASLPLKQCNLYCMADHLDRFYNIRET